MLIPDFCLVRVTKGEMYDVAVDLRRSSPSFGRWAGVILSAANHRQLWIPPGFAHGFVVTSDSADFLYKTTDYCAPEFGRCNAWDDATLAINWPLNGMVPQLSAKDRLGASLASLKV